MLSFAESIEIQCPRCATPFPAETWVTVDGEERPDLVAQILAGTVHEVICPHCGQRGDVPAPLLYHDGRRGRVLLAVPPSMPEHEWRAAGQTLLWSVIGALPEARRLPYLGQLQAEAGIAGIAQVIRDERLAGSEGADADLPPIVLAVQSLLAAHGPVELQAALRDHPILRDPQAITILRELAHAAFGQGENEAGSGFGAAADLLVNLGALAGPATLDDPALEELAFSVLRTQSGADLAAVVDAHPELLDDQIDPLLETWERGTRAGGKSRLADGMRERRQALREMRAEYRRQQPLLEAVQYLLNAETPDAVEEAIVEYGALLTPAVDEILARLAVGADHETAALIAARRELLQQVRAQLDRASGG